MLCYVIYIMHVMLLYTTYITNNYTFLSCYILNNSCICCWSPGTTRRSSPSWQTPLRRFPWDFHMGFPYGISIWDFHGISGRHIGPLWVVVEWLSSGKHTKNYGKSPFLMGKSTISMTIFNSYFDITRGYRWIFSHVDGLVEIYHWNIEV